ncbi:hypothetical protein [Dactylosporangium sp. CA-092794]|uniref:hypothetical protein n=1 Tax=Dactylosporangium sp. CA-092794 TaxID=3239929 RepID=UPI003D8A5DD4
MHLFFNDPRVAYVTRHRRVEPGPLVGLVVGGVGVAALGVFVGSVGYDHGSAPPPPATADLGVAIPVPTPQIDNSGSLAYGTVPAGPVPVLDFDGSRRTTAKKAKAAKEVEAVNTPPTTEPPTQETQPTAEPSEEPSMGPGMEPSEEPAEEPADGRRGWQHRHRDRQWRAWWEGR